MFSDNRVDVGLNGSAGESSVNCPAHWMCYIYLDSLPLELRYAIMFISQRMCEAIFFQLQNVRIYLDIFVNVDVFLHTIYVLMRISEYPRMHTAVVVPCIVLSSLW